MVIVITKIVDWTKILLIFNDSYCKTDNYIVEIIILIFILFITLINILLIWIGT